jgi:TonB family protein
MPPPVTRSCLLALAVVITVFAPVTAQSPSPATPGGVALLTNNLDAKAIEEVMAAIGAADPAVRTVAARIAAVTAHPPFALAISRAMAGETDPVATTEQVRALLNIRGDAAIEAIDAALDRMPAPAALLYAAWLGRHRADALSERLARIARAAPNDPTTLVDMIDDLIETRPELAVPLVRAWRPAVPSDQWRSLVAGIELKAASPPLVDEIRDALAAGGETRVATMWGLVRRLGAGDSLPAALIDAVNAGPADPPDADAAVPREILARQGSRKPARDLSDQLAQMGDTHRSELVAVARTATLSGAERGVLRKVLGDLFPGGAGKASQALERDGTTLRMLPTLWPGLLKSVLAAASCVPENDPPSVGVIEVQYRPNLTPAKLSLVPTPLPAGCQRALTTMARLTVADGAYLPPEGSGEVLLLPLDDEAVACAEAPVSDAVARIGGGVKPPKKIKDVKPVYPLSAQQKRVQGTVVLEAVIGATGCTTDVKVIRGIPALNLAALQAVWRWRFAPTLVDGQAMRVRATLTVNFSLE